MLTQEHLDAVVESARLMKERGEGRKALALQDVAVAVQQSRHAAEQQELVRLLQDASPVEIYTLSKVLDSLFAMGITANHQAKHFTPEQCATAIEWLQRIMDLDADLVAEAFQAAGDYYNGKLFSGQDGETQAVLVADQGNQVIEALQMLEEGA